MKLVSIVYDFLNKRITYDELINNLEINGYKDITSNLVNDDNILNNDKFIIEFNNLSDKEFVDIITKYIKSNVVF